MSVGTKAQALAAADWIGPQPEGDWNRLTLGEQQSYRRQACRTMGAIYSISVSEGEISVAVSLPDELSLSGLTKAEAKSIERFLHDKFEDAIVWIIASRGVL